MTSFFVELKRRRVYRIAIAYAIVAWLLLQLASIVLPGFGAPGWVLRVLIVVFVLFFPVAILLAWAVEGRAEKNRSALLRSETPAAEATAVPEASVAILPFADMSEAHDQTYFCDGLAQEIMDALGRVDGLRLASRTSSFRFRDGEHDAREIGRMLNVASVMEGSVRKVGSRVRITAQLVDAGNGYQLWSERFDRDQEDIFAIQEEIARGIARALRVSLKTPETLNRQRYAPRDMRAYDFYLRGRELEGARDKRKSNNAAQMYRRAIEIDPDYPQAHAGLADVLIELLLWRLARPEEVLEEARTASRRALELAPELAEGHVAHAHVLDFSGDHDAAAAAFERALALDPESYEANYYFARHCVVLRKYGRAIELFEAAHRVNPDEFQALNLAIGAAENMGDRKLADDLARRALEACQRQLTLDPEDPRAHYFIASLLDRFGDRAVGRRHAETALHLRPNDYGTLYNCACYYARTGAPERALDLLDRAVDTGGGFRGWIEQDADLVGLRESPRFREILSRLG